MLGVYHKAGEKEVKEAIEGSLAAHKHWRNLAPEHRLGIFMKVCSSDLISRQSSRRVTPANEAQCSPLDDVCISVVLC